MQALSRHFLAWRVFRTGNREIVESIVAPEHRGPSPSLTAELRQWPGAHYWSTPDRSELILVRPLQAARTERWLLHLVLFGITVICSLGAGAAQLGWWWTDPQDGRGPLGWLRSSIEFFIHFASGSPQQILSGWTFAVPLLTILLVHELGHYIAAKRYAVDVSPPFFLPVPPTLSPLGSLGAFLRLRSPVLDRRQLMDIGAAGPLAGFVVAIGVLIWGYSTATAIPGTDGTHGLLVTFGSSYFLLGDSLLTHALREHFIPGSATVQMSLPGFAGWAGGLITGLNLLPLSQLDGGHVMYGLFGRHQAKVALLTVLGLLYLSWTTPAWLFWIVLTLMVGGGRWSHPAVLCPERPVPRSRIVVGWLCILVFLASFVPAPFGG